MDSRMTAMRGTLSRALFSFSSSGFLRRQTLRERRFTRPLFNRYAEGTGNAKFPDTRGRFNCEINCTGSLFSAALGEIRIILHANSFEEISAIPIYCSIKCMFNKRDNTTPSNYKIYHKCAEKT